MMNSASIVRPAVAADHGEIWRLFRLCHAENGMLPISERKVEYHLDRFLHPGRIETSDTGPRGMVGVIGDVGHLQGAIVLMIAAHWYTDCPSMDELLNFVDPAYRSSNHAKTLIAYAKHIVDDIRKGQPDFKLIIGVLSTKRTAAKVRLYDQQLVAAGSFYVHPADDSAEPPRHRYRV